MDADKIEPVFPRDHRYQGHNGMSLRDYYAGQALPAILARLYQVADRNGERFENVYAIAAAASLEAADAMLAARKS